MEAEVFTKVFLGSGGIMGLLIFAYNHFVNKIEKVDTKTNQNASDLKDLKHHVSETYVKSATVAELKVEQTNSINRLHYRIDETQSKIDNLGEKMHDGFDELKTLIMEK